MQRVLLSFCSRVMLGSSVVTGIACAQAADPSSMPSMSAAISSANSPSESSREALDNGLDPASLLPDLPLLSNKKTSAIGGTIEKLDRIRDQFTVRVFGGGKMRVFFDPRTQIYSDGSKGSASALRIGDRVYVDTVLNGDVIFARNIRIKSVSVGEIQGAVVSYQDNRRELIVRDALSPRPMKLLITPQTRLVDAGNVTSASQLVPGTLVSLKFGLPHEGINIAEEVSVLAVPGASITFAGRVKGLDLSIGLLVLTSATDGKTYEIYLDPTAISVDVNLRESVDVIVQTHFEGNRYVAQSLTVN